MGYRLEWMPVGGVADQNLFGLIDLTDGTRSLLIP